MAAIKPGTTIPYISPYPALGSNTSTAGPQLTVSPDGNSSVLAHPNGHQPQPIHAVTPGVSGHVETASSQVLGPPDSTRREEHPSDDSDAPSPPDTPATTLPAPPAAETAPPTGPGDAPDQTPRKTKPNAGPPFKNVKLSTRGLKDEKRIQICQLLLEGNDTQRTATLAGVSRGAVYKIRNNLLQYGSVRKPVPENHKKLGQPPKLTERHLDALETFMRENGWLSQRDQVKWLKDEMDLVISQCNMSRACGKKAWVKEKFPTPSGAAAASASCAKKGQGGERDAEGDALSEDEEMGDGGVGLETLSAAATASASLSPHPHPSAQQQQAVRAQQTPRSFMTPLQQGRQPPQYAYAPSPLAQPGQTVQYQYPSMPQGSMQQGGLGGPAHSFGTPMSANQYSTQAHASHMPQQEQMQGHGMSELPAYPYQTA